MYYCVHCKGYHLTSQERPLFQKKREKIFKQRIKDTNDLVKNPEQAAAWKADSLPFPNENQTNQHDNRD